MHCNSTVHTFKILKMGPTVLFTYLKFILLQFFQFSVLAKINSVQTDPNCQEFKHTRVMMFY